MTTMMNKLLLCAAMSMSLPAWALVDIKGAKFNDTYQLGNQTLQLNGVGVRVKIIVDVYAAGLYVGKKERAANALINQGGAKSMQIVLLRDLTGEDFADAMVKGFKANNSEADIARHQARLNEVRQRMLSFGLVKKGTVIRIDHVPGSGTGVLINGVHQGTDIEGDDFYAAILKIWLGQHPVDGDLKDALTGEH